MIKKINRTWGVSMRAQLNVIILLVMVAQIRADDFELLLGQPDINGFPELCLTIAARDSGGTLVLDSGMVAVYEDTVRNYTVNLKSISDRNEKVAILIAVDASMSMVGEPIDSIKAAIIEFLRNKSSDDQVGIISFHDNVEIISDFSTNSDTLIQKTNLIKAKGKITELHYGIVKGLEMLHASDSIANNRVLVVLSDGKDEGTAYSDNDAIERANQYNVPVYTIGYHTKSQKKYLRVLERISDKTGGHYNDAPSTKELNNIYSHVFAQILEQDKLCFQSKLFKADSLEHTFTVSVILGDDRNVSKEVTFRSPAKQSKILSLSWLIVAGLLLVLLMVLYLYLISKKKAKEDKEKFIDQKRKLEQELDAKKSQDDNDPTADATVMADEEKVGRNTIISRPENRSSHDIKLYFENGPLTGQAIAVSDEISIGRGEMNDLIIPEQTVSGKHCRIAYQGDQYILTDLQSTNGTVVNGNKIQSCAINQGDKIQLGKVLIFVR